MDSILNSIFEMWQETEGWKQCCQKEDTQVVECVQALKNEIPDIPEEKMMDFVFGILYKARKDAFLQGFKCAMKLQEECSDE